MLTVKEKISIFFEKMARFEDALRDVPDDTTLKSGTIKERLLGNAKANMKKGMLRRYLFVKYFFTDQKKFFDLFSSRMKLGVLTTFASGMFFAQFLSHFGYSPNTGNIVGIFLALFVDAVIMGIYINSIDAVYKKLSPFLWAILIGQIFLMWMESLNVFS